MNCQVWHALIPPPAQTQRQSCAVLYYIRLNIFIMISKSFADCMPYLLPADQVPVTPSKCVQADLPHPGPESCRL